MNAILFPALLLVCGADDKAAEPKLPVGRETTFVTGPLDRNGYIDYEAALNDRLGKGITPDRNAVVALWKAFGPPPAGEKDLPPEYVRRLGIDRPPPEGDYFIGLSQYLKTRTRLDPGTVQTVLDSQGRTALRPWKAADHPEVAAWLRANDKPLAAVVVAPRRPAYFNPLVSPRGPDEPSSLIGCRLHLVPQCRAATDALASRAMLGLREKKYDEAWRDLLACHRLGRLLTRGATLIEALVGVAVHRLAAAATLAYLDRADLTARQVLDHLKDLHALPPLARMADTVDLGDRFQCLDSIQSLRHGASAGKDQTVLGAVDWGFVLRAANARYDRIAAAMRIEDRAAREKEIDTLDREWEAERKNGPDLKKLLGGTEPEREVAQAIGETLTALLGPAFRKCQVKADEAVQIERNLDVAFALAAYRADNGRYPQRLADLGTKYLATVPADLFNGQPLIYKPVEKGEKGYLFYSVGPNGKDDGGRWVNDDPPGDDPGVRMPLPELNKK